MLPAVHAAQVVLTLVAARMVARKLRQLGSPRTHARDRVAARQALAAIETGEVDEATTLALDGASDYHHEILEAAIEALEGEGDVGAFVHTASLDAQHRTLAGVRVIRGFATLAGTLGLLGAMTHHFWLLHADHGPSLDGLTRAEEDANAGALISMGIGLATGLLLFLASRVIRGRAIARLAEIVRFADEVEATAARRQQWTGEARE